MRKLLAAGLVTVCMAAATSAHATPQIGIEIFVDGALVASTPLVSGGVDSLTYILSPYFNTISITSTGVPATTDPNFGTISINASASFVSGSHKLALIATQTGLTGIGFGGLANTFTYNGLSNPGAITSSVGANYVDASNTPYLETTKIASTPNEGGVVTYSTAFPINYTPTPPPLFSETEEYDFTFVGQALAQSSAQITGVVPEPMSLALLGSSLIGLGAFRRNRKS